MADWLTDFVEHTSYGETPPKIMWWIGVVTIAGALRRKVWIEQDSFQWTPNFYLLIVGKPGIVKKSTSIGLGTRLLEHVEGIDFGPQSVTWQQLISHMADSTIVVDIDGVPFESSCVTISLSEFGSFFDPKDRNLVDNLTDLWDGKLHTFRKETKTSGCDEVKNPWVNIYACTTPRWLKTHFSEELVGGGFACRCIWLLGNVRDKRVSYPILSMPPQRIMQDQRFDLCLRLQRMAELKGEYKMTPEACIWGDEWYEKYLDRIDALGDTIEADFEQRKQTHLHKLAMVISASRGNFPVIDVEDLMEADARLNGIQEDAQAIFGYSGQSPISRTSNGIIEVLARTGPLYRRELYRRYFFRTISNIEFESALNSAKASGLVTESGDVTDPVIGLAR